MFEMKLGSLLRLILFLSSIKEKSGLDQKQRPFARTDPAAAIEIGRAPVTMLRDWPRPLRDALRSMALATLDNPAALSFRTIFPNFYRHLFYTFPRSEFGFLHDVFERFVIEDWKGLVRGQAPLLLGCNAPELPMDTCTRGGGDGADLRTPYIGPCPSASN